MGDIGSAISGGINGMASVYNNERNIQMQQETNRQNYRIFREGNEFNAEQADLNRSFQSDMFNQANEFSAGQAALNRGFQSAEAQKGRDWQEQMYNSYQSPEALAAQYQRLGIAPASAVSGGQAFTSTPLPSGASASASGVSGAQASAGSAHLDAPRIDNNPISDFLSAYNAFSSTQAGVNATKLKNIEQSVNNQYQVEVIQSNLRHRNAEIDKLIADKETSEEQKNVLRSEKARNDIQIEVLNSQKDELKQEKHLENEERRERIKNIILQNSAQEIQNKALPRLLSSQYNLNNAQAAAALKAADAALKQAFAAKYNAVTGRMQYSLDKKKYKEVYKDNIEASTKQLNASADYLDQGAEHTEKENDWYEADKLIGVGEFLLNQQTERITGLVGGAFKMFGK